MKKHEPILTQETWEKVVRWSAHESRGLSLSPLGGRYYQTTEFRDRTITALCGPYGRPRQD